MNNGFLDKPAFYVGSSKEKDFYLSFKQIGNFAIHGYPGSGKTFYIQTMLKHLKSLIDSKVLNICIWSFKPFEFKKKYKNYIFNKASDLFATIENSINDDVPTLVIIDELSEFLDEERNGEILRNYLKKNRNKKIIFGFISQRMNRLYKGFEEFIKTRICMYTKENIEDFIPNLDASNLKFDKEIAILNSNFKDQILITEIIDKDKYVNKLTRIYKKLIKNSIDALAFIVNLCLTRRKDIHTEEQWKRLIDEIEVMNKGMNSDIIYIAFKFGFYCKTHHIDFHFKGKINNLYIMYLLKLTNENPLENNKKYEDYLGDFKKPKFKNCLDIHVSPEYRDEIKMFAIGSKPKWADWYLFKVTNNDSDEAKLIVLFFASKSIDITKYYSYEVDAISKRYVLIDLLDYRQNFGFTIFIN